MIKQKPTIEIRENEYFFNGKNTKQKEIVLCLYDFRFVANVNDDRDLKLAKRLADDFCVDLIERSS